MSNIIKENNKEKSANGFDFSKFMNTYGIVAILVVMVVGISLRNPQFLSINNIMNLLTQSSMY